jgi:hypothetical protein
MKNDSVYPSRERPMDAAQHRQRADLKRGKRRRLPWPHVQQDPVDATDRALPRVDQLHVQQIACEIHHCAMS